MNGPNLCPDRRLGFPTASRTSPPGKAPPPHPPDRPLPGLDIGVLRIPRLLEGPFATDGAWAVLLERADPIRRRRALRLRTHEPVKALELLVAEALCRTMLVRHVGPDAWTVPFTCGRGMRPALKAPGPTVSWSHAGTLVVCAVTPLPFRVGIDTEPLRLLDFRGMLPFLSEPEARYIESPLSDEARSHRFLAVWTRKEAYSKALSLGLTLPFQGFSVVTAQANAPLPGLDPFGFDEHLQPDGSHIVVAWDGSGQGMTASWRTHSFEQILDESCRRPTLLDDRPTLVTRPIADDGC